MMSKSLYFSYYSITNIRIFGVILKLSESGFTGLKDGQDTYLTQVGRLDWELGSPLNRKLC